MEKYWGLLKSAPGSGEKMASSLASSKPACFLSSTFGVVLNDLKLSTCSSCGSLASFGSFSMTEGEICHNLRTLRGDTFVRR